MHLKSAILRGKLFDFPIDLTFRNRCVDCVGSATSFSIGNGKPISTRHFRDLLKYHLFVKA